MHSKDCPPDHALESSLVAGGLVEAIENGARAGKPLFAVPLVIIKHLLEGTLSNALGLKAVLPDSKGLPKLLMIESPGHLILLDFAKSLDVLSKLKILKA